MENLRHFINGYYRYTLTYTILYTGHLQMVFKPLSKQFIQRLQKYKSTRVTWMNPFRAQSAASNPHWKTVHGSECQIVTLNRNINSSFTKSLLFLNKKSLIFKYIHFQKIVSMLIIPPWSLIIFLRFLTNFRIRYSYW